MKLTDVARATLSELANDYLNWLLRHEQLPWSTHSAEYSEVASVKLDKPDYQDDVLYQSSIHILKQKHRFDKWLLSEDSMAVANCILVLCNRLVLMLSRQIENQLATFREEGGFTEALTAERAADILREVTLSEEELEPIIESLTDKDPSLEEGTASDASPFTPPSEGKGKDEGLSVSVGIMKNAAIPTAKRTPVQGKTRFLPAVSGGAAWRRSIYRKM